jgi:predicted transglutaminase-like cysteine proteinase
MLKIVSIALLMCIEGFAFAHAGSNLDQFARTGGNTLAPFGWIVFCVHYPGECNGNVTEPNETVLPRTQWKIVLQINRWVNANIKPMSDIDHWGIAEKWSYPSDGYGDCEDYVLLKRKMLKDAGLPDQALLITIVLDRETKGHAVLTVRADDGEFVLDNLTDNILLWTKTGYRFLKRQSLTDPKRWVTISDPQAAHAMASPGDGTSTVKAVK